MRRAPAVPGRRCARAASFRPSSGPRWRGRARPPGGALRVSVRPALTSSLVMPATTALVLAFLLVWVVPQVAQLFADTGTPLPLATRALLGLVSLARATWWLALLVALAGGVAWRRWAA